MSANDPVLLTGYMAGMKRTESYLVRAIPFIVALSNSPRANSSEPKPNQTAIKGLIHIVNPEEKIKINLRQFFSLSLQPLPVPLFTAVG